MAESERVVLHLDLDAFFVSAERRRDAQLNNRPIIIGGQSGRAVVASCSYEARRFGVRSAMPMALARRLCPEALVLNGDMDLYTRCSQEVTSIIAEQVPSFEKASIDEFYADLSGMDRYFGCYRWASELRQRIMNETHLPLSFGMANCKTVSKVATGEAKPNGQHQVPQGAERPFLAPLPVERLPMAGPKTVQLLRQLGVVRIATLQETSPDLLVQVLGNQGRSLWEKANAQDLSPVMPYREQKSLSTELTFEQDQTDPLWLKRMVIALTEKLAFRLRKRGRLTASIGLRIRYADFDTRSMQQKIPYSAFDHQLIPHTTALFSRLYDRRLRVRLIGIRFGDLIYGAPQLHLFEDTQSKIRLIQAMDSVNKRFGEGSVLRASSVDMGRKGPNLFLHEDA